MKKNSLILAALLLGLSSACQPKEAETSSMSTGGFAPEMSHTATLTFRRQTLSRSSEPCQGDTCASVSIQSLTATGGNAALRDSLNQYIKDYLLRLQLIGNPDAHVTQQGNASQIVAEQFIRDHANFRKQTYGQGASLDWELTVTMKPIYQTPSLVSLQLNSVGYMGGAHGFNVTTLQSFDSTGHALRLQEIVTDTTQLRRQIEQEFRRVRQLGNASFEEQGFFTQGQGLPLPQDFALTQKGLLIYYNAYEVNAYAFGPTELLLPYRQLKRLLKPYL